MKQPAGCLQHLDGPNLNGSLGDHVMASKALPSQEVLRQLLRYEPETGKLFWKARSHEHFTDYGKPSASKAASWNGNFSGKEAFIFSDRRGYKKGKIQGTDFQAHRVIWKLVHGSDPVQVDHINGQQGDNRLANLRNCTNSENSRNYKKPAGKSSKYRGVCWIERDGKWGARISVNGRKTSLGNFTSEADAALAYDKAARELHGEFATLNFHEAAQ